MHYFLNYVHTFCTFCLATEKNVLNKTLIMFLQKINAEKYMMEYVYNLHDVFDILSIAHFIKPYQDPVHVKTGFL